MSEFPVHRLLMTCDTVGGVWTFALELAEALGAFDIEVLLACLGGHPSPGQQSDAVRLRNVQIAASRYKLEWMQDPWADVEASGEWLLHLADRFRPDVVHLNSFGHGTLPWQSPVVLTAHSCVLSWWSSVRREAPPREWNRYRDLVEGALSSADVVTAPSHAMVACLARHYRSAPPDACVIPNGRRARRFRQAPKEPFIMAAGRLWDEAKNIAAVARLAPRLPWPCYIAGEPHHPDGSTARFPGCEMLGRLPSRDLTGWYARASIYALPARYEPFGLSALEAALSGCALVLGDIASLREVWGDAALFVPPDDDSRLEASLRLLIGDPRLRAEMAARSLARARTFTADAMAAAYMGVYEAAIDSRRLACAS